MEKSQKIQKETKNSKLKKAKNFLIFSLVLGMFIIALTYFFMKYSNRYENDFEFFRDFNNKLLAISFLGSWIALFLWSIDFFKYFLGSMVVVFLGFLFTYDLGKLDKRIFLKNFSNTPKTVVVNGKKYKVDSNLYEILEFPKGDIKIGNESINKSGCYVVNLSYPKKIYKLYFVQKFSFNGNDFNVITPFSKIKYKIYKVDDDPNCWVSSSKESDASYYIEAY